MARCSASLPTCLPNPTLHPPSHPPTHPSGERLARLPVEPMYGKVLLASGEMGCAAEALAVVAMVSSDAVFHAPR